MGHTPTMQEEETHPRLQSPRASWRKVLCLFSAGLHDREEQGPRTHTPALIGDLPWLSVPDASRGSTDGPGVRQGLLGEGRQKQEA